MIRRDYKGVYTKKCPNCLSDFKTNIHNKRYCSETCKNSWRTKRKRNTLSNCKECKHTYTYMVNSICGFCQLGKMSNLHTQKVNTCGMCNKEYVIWNIQNKRYTEICSEKCRKDYDSYINKVIKWD